MRTKLRLLLKLLKVLFAALIAYLSLGQIQHSIKVPKRPSVQENKEENGNKIRKFVRRTWLAQFEPDITALLGRNPPDMNETRVWLEHELNVISINRLMVKQKIVGSNRKRKKLCPEIPPNLVGRMELNASQSAKGLEITVEKGGKYEPPNCLARHHVAVVIPFRNRTEQLNTLLANLHPILQKQQLKYRVFVVEQFGNDTYNKGRLMNSAFVAALKMENFECFVFHDVDLLLQDDRNMHSCPTFPRHLSVAIDKFNYSLPYEQLVGGVFAIRKEHYLRVNGYSNVYWGWGAEDDDMWYRLNHVGIPIDRPPAKIARYTMLKHDSRPVVLKNNARFPLLWTGRERYHLDGVSTLKHLNCSILAVTNQTLFTHILVDIGSFKPAVPH